MKTHFDHEKLQVYHASLKFITWTTDLLERVPKGLSVSDQLDRASTSIPLNIAEGNGKFTSADRCRFLDNARGSVGLIRSNSPDRLHEENAVLYHLGNEDENGD